MVAALVITQEEERVSRQNREFNQSEMVRLRLKLAQPGVAGVKLAQPGAEGPNMPTTPNLFVIQKNAKEVSRLTDMNLKLPGPSLQRVFRLTDKDLKLLEKTKTGRDVFRLTDKDLKLLEKTKTGRDAHFNAQDIFAATLKKHGADALYKASHTMWPSEAGKHKNSLQSLEQQCPALATPAHTEALRQLRAAETKEQKVMENLRNSIQTQQKNIARASEAT
ncbi:hypothetical protein T484DRAFT_1859895 [Baffinella frigidus]|nr:hypothetical protein T484DRAFT_1859895 [Cryptophyta sp. CCMP2293]